MLVIYIKNIKHGLGSNNLRVNSNIIITHKYHHQIYIPKYEP